jgi:hypothetical protein
VKYQNARCFVKVILTKHLVWNGFTADYEMWVFHSEKYIVVAGRVCEWPGGANRMDEMPEAIWPEFDLDTKDPLTLEIKEFFRLLKASEESLHKHMKVTMLAFVTQFMAIKNTFFFSKNCYNELLKWIGDVLLNPNKLPKDMYYSKKLVKGLGMDYEKIDVYRNSCMLFLEGTQGRKQMLKIW